MSFPTYFTSVIFTLFLFRSVCPTCVLQNGKYDLTLLDWPGGWPVAVPTKDGISIRYEISLCRPLNYSSHATEECMNSSICKITDNSSTSYADTILGDSTLSIADANVGTAFTLYFITKKLCDKSTNYRASISFACGPNLGAPEVLLHNECQVNFFWRTSAACQIKPKRKEVPCYVIDSDGNTRDLSYLIKNQGGHFVTTPHPAIDFVINICSEIVPDNSTQNCPANSSACRFIGSEHISFGSPSERLQLTPDGLVLTYRSDNTELMPPGGCKIKPKTRVLFKCPSRGQSQPPKLISDSNCQYEVDWHTEHACPESSLKGNIKTCQFIQDIHGVEIDLSPLKNKTEYHVSSNVSGTEIEFSLSICQGLVDSACGKNWKSNSVCMTNSSSKTSEVIGTTSGSELKYVDGQVILTYPKGKQCSSGITQTTVINFICSDNASDNGNGLPEHVSSIDCLHLFKWETKHACLKQPLDTFCSVIVNKKKINLEKLYHAEDAPWEAVDRRGIDITNKDEYFLNICGRLSNLGNFSNCGVDSSACLRSSDGQYVDLGHFSTAPVYDSLSNSVKLEYTMGSQCKGNQFWKSTINFICRPGLANSEPVLKSIDKEGCHYEFEWLSAVACPEGLIKGTNCKVYDSSLGVSYDLSPLESKFRMVSNGTHDFHLSVCGHLIQSPCSSDPHRNVSVCLVEKKNTSNTRVIGEMNSTVSYLDGIINLDYFSGDPYSDKNSTSMQTIITFICDYDAGNGEPLFIEQDDFIFVFHWYTSLVCPHSVAMECLVHDPVSHLIYDLSDLSTSNQNWISFVTQGKKKQKIYLNVCRSLALPTICDSNAAACIVDIDGDKEKVGIPNIGRVIEPPVLRTPGHIILTYTHGDPCRAFGEDINYSTKIHFLCAENGKSDTGPRFLSKVGACQYTILWTTKAACPSGNFKSENSCQLTYPESGFIFDLTSLSIEGNRKPYEVISGDRTFQLNICGKVADGCHSSDGKSSLTNVSVCETKNDILLSVLGVTNDYTLSYSEGKDLTLTYKNITKTPDQPKAEVQIRFPCSNTTDAQPKFIQENPLGRYIFEMKTSLACIPKHFDCSFVDSYGNEYDLSPLARYSNGNWEVPDGRIGLMNLRYHINFCRPLNIDLSYLCPGGTSSACQTDTSRPQSNGFNLGSQMATPTVDSNGSVTIRYTEGSFCHDGLFKRSTTINLFCSDKEEELRFVGETPECEYIFSLKTPVACPVKTSSGMDCRVRDPVFGYQFDLQRLQRKGGNYNITVGDYIYSFNVCEKLNGFTGNCENAGICQTKPSESTFVSKSLGLPSSELVYRKGIITLLYEDGTGGCHGTYNRSSIITFTCDHAYEDKDGPTFITEEGDCTYLFEWPTVHACPPFDVMDCSCRDDKGNFYDLSKLSLSNDNYYVKNPNAQNKTFAINLCRSVVPTPDSICPYTAAACLLDSTNAINSVNLGRVGQAPYFEDGHIKIKYTTGDPCNDEKTSSARFMQTIIEFTCDKKKIESEPEFIGKDGCNYYFDWYTAYACIPEVQETAGNCSAVDPVTGYKFDLAPLRNHSSFPTQRGQHMYYISVCDGIGDTPCHNHSGMCQEEIAGSKRHWNGGIKNSNLQYTDNILYLNYSGGDSCHNGQYQRNTIIQFECGAGIGAPVFMHESQDCTYFFLWETELACHPLVHCAIKNGSNLYDLSALTETYSVAGSIVPNDHSSYYVSVCGSLPTINGINCPSGAAICRMTTDPKTSMVTVQSLGRVEFPPMIDFHGYATAIYTNGSMCSTKPDQQNRARIIFMCEPEPGFLGEPVLTDITEDCVYVFEWKTSVVCPEEPTEQPISSCDYTDVGKGIYINLRPIQRIGSYYMVPTTQNNKTEDGYMVNVCETVSSSNLDTCRNSSICFQENNKTYNYGLTSTMKFTYDGSRLRMSLTDGDDCPSGFHGKRSSEIFFVCDPSAGIGTPVLHKKYTCLVVFLWKTTLVCQNTYHQCSFDIDGNHYDLSLLSSLSHNWNTTDSNNNLYWINLCRGIQPSEETLACSPGAAVCLKDDKGSHLSLGMVQTMQVKANNSDLLLTFGAGDHAACSSVNSTTLLSATTRLVLRCGHSLGRPKVLLGPDEQCFYDFMWETSLACPEKTEEVMIEENNTLYDSRFQYSMDLTDILNHSFSVPGKSKDESYIYLINLSKVFQNSSDTDSPCLAAAVCQTKPGTPFHRDIGSFDTRKFYIRGSELHLILRGGPCGKDITKNVTTIINMGCSSAAGIGTPIFLYESGKCDYVFEWETIAVCPGYHRKKPTTDSTDNEPENVHYKDVQTSSHTTQTVICLILSVVVISGLAFILVNPNRRSAVASRFRGLFGRVNLPHFRYKRCNNERLILIDAAQAVHYDNENGRDVELLT